MSPRYIFSQTARV